MISDDKFGLSPLWEASLDIYRHIAIICEKHQLRYYATDGTALGAVRHKGFIPWDDDLDVSMPRPDYEKFIKIAERELPGYLKFANWKNTPEIDLLFGKIQETRRDVVESLEKSMGIVLSNGLFVDIFPIDGFPNGKLNVWRIQVEDFILRQILWYRSAPMNAKLPRWKKCAKIFMGCLFSFIMPKLRTRQDILCKYEKMCKRQEFDKCDYTGRTCSSLTILRRKPLRKTAWGIPTEVEFHDTVIKVPEDSDAHLRNEYYKWDYMQLPPLKDQHPTHTQSQHFPWWLGPTTNKKPY